jgi:hypothetical protein
MVAALAGVDPDVEVEAAAGAEEDGGALGGEPRAVGADEYVGAEQLLVLGAELPQPRRARLLAHFDEVFGVEAEPAAGLEHRLQGGDVDGVLALVVDNAASVPAVAALGEDPGREPLVPFVVEAADHVAVAVAEHGRKCRVLMPLGEEERPFALLRGCGR